MKRVLNVLAGSLMVVAFTACGSSGGGKSGKIKMTVDERSGDYFYLAGSGVATVDWGDSSEKVSKTLNENGVIFGHDYPNRSIRTITINGDNITKFEHHNGSTSLDVSRCPELNFLDVHSPPNLDVSKNTALTRLIVWGGRLTSLDVSKNTALSHLSVSGRFSSLDVSKNKALIALDVSECRFSNVALNNLFGTLHSNTVLLEQGGGRFKRFDMPKTIIIGSADCNRSIAESKGWTVR